MNIDRTLFLAFATSLSAAACAGSTDVGEENASGDSAISMSADGNTTCWAPQTESASGTSKDWYVEQLGFDPVNDYPAAEGFCIDMVWAGGIAPIDSIRWTQQVQLIDKCYAYAKAYVPFTTYNSFYKLKEIKAAGPVEETELFGKMYELDREISTDSVVCITSTAKKLCANQTNLKECRIIASQLKDAGSTTKPNGVRDCIAAKKFDAYTCTESAGQSF